MTVLPSRIPRPWRLVVLLPLLLSLVSCGSEKIHFHYPDEQLDLGLRNLATPAVYIDAVTDMRPLEQRQGEGHFFNIKFPKDSSWQQPATEVYAQALIQDVGQTQLVDVVALRGQADFILSADLISLGCHFHRSASSFLLPTALGMGAGLAIGDDSSQRVSTGLAISLLALAAIPMPSRNLAEAEVRVTLKDREGKILWQESCRGEAQDRVYASPTARQDQQYVDRFLTVAVKRCNACLLGQMRQVLIGLATEDGS